MVSFLLIYTALYRITELSLMLQKSLEKLFQKENVCNVPTLVIRKFRSR